MNFWGALGGGSSEALATKADMDKLKRENEFLKKGLHRKNSIIESLQATPLPDPNF